jgi:hypothetical protein
MEILTVKTGPIEEPHQPIHHIPGAMGRGVRVAASELGPFVTQL